MASIQGYRITGRFTVEANCGHLSTLKFVRTHDGLCKACSEPSHNQHASREEQHARYIDCGPLAWDDRTDFNGDN